MNPLAMNELYSDQLMTSVSDKLGVSVEVVTVILAAVLLWSLVWKLLGLWKSARKESPIWFVVLALFNTLGILPILYIFVFSKWGNKNSARPTKKPAKRRR